MNDDYLIIYKSILPDYFELVLKAKALVEDEKKSVSDACKEVGISRSTFYKYKDKIFKASSSYGKKSIISLKTADTKGVLSAVLSEIYSFGANVITINQAMPIKNVAFITLAIDISETSADIVELINKLKTIDSVKSVSVIAIE